jgi:flagellar hook protein FlgE
MVNGQVVTPLEAGSYQYYTDGNGTMVLSERYIEPYQLIFDANDGTFISIGGEDSISLKMSLIETNTVDPVTGVNSNFSDIAIDFTGCKNLNNGGTSTMGALKGINGDGAGKKLGALTGLSVDTSGKVVGSYDNGNTVVLCQIAVAQFSNASGLEKVGDNCYQTTLNSGDCDGIGVEITADGI